MIYCLLVCGNINCVPQGQKIKKTMPEIYDTQGLKWAVFLIVQCLKNTNASHSFNFRYKLSGKYALLMHF